MSSLAINASSSAVEGFAGGGMRDRRETRYSGRITGA